MNQVNSLVLTNLTLAQLVAVAAALNTKEHEVEFVTETVPLDEPSCGECVAPCETPAVERRKWDNEMQALRALFNDDRFEYRTITSLVNALNKIAPLYNEKDVFTILDDEGYKYETKRRRSDGELLVKLVKPAVVSTQKAWVDAEEEAAQEFNNARAEPRIIDRIVELLKDPRYTWRTIDTLSDKTGLSRQGLLDYLEANNVEYQLNYRNSDDKEIIALSSRL